MNSLRWIPILLLAGAINLTAGPALPLARAHVEGLTVYRGGRVAFDDFDQHIKALLKEGRDAGTKTMSFVFGIRRHASKLLTVAQSEGLVKLLEQHEESNRRLHEERNVLRGFFFAQAWRMPLLEGAERGLAMEELQGWLGAWLQITLHERIGHHQLCRDVWQILTPDQREAVVDGDWDRHVRKSTGHKRDYFGDRIVVRALGKPSDPDRFRTVSDTLRAEHKAIQRDLLDAERRWRMLTLAHPAVSDELLAAEWNRMAAALGAFFMHQAGQYVRLTRAGYDLKDDELRVLVAAQPKRELDELEEKVREKLVAGGNLFATLRAAHAEE